MQRPAPPAFLFATGIENSNPRIKGGTVRVDEMARCHHYERWREDFALVQELGLSFLRYGPPIHTTFLGPGRHDWNFADATFGELQRRDIVPIVDLCHFGVPDWIGDFQNPDFPALFADYAGAFARRFPWVQLYTPVNEMYICALFSARYGWWNEQGTTDRSFVTALKHIVRANILAMEAILKVRRDAIFIQSESTEYFHAESPAAIAPAEARNAERFLSLDLNYGRRVDSGMYEYLMDSGMTREEYHFFLAHSPLKRHCIMGNDYYWTNEHLVREDGSTRASGEVFGYAVLTRQYHDRYGLPVMHTETNLRDDNPGDAERWLWKQWANVLRVRNDGVAVIGFTWYSLTDQVDWNSALREENGHIDTVGLYDLDRRIRPVGRAFQRLVSQWREVLPAQSLCLQVPVVMPSDHDPDGMPEAYWAMQAGRRAR
jgi:beta-glucosidase/6-phospho-beta-glucosidase/beta-galactosidase